MIYPMFAIVLLILCVALLNLYWRVSSVKNKTVRVAYFRVFDTGDAKIPERIIAGSRNYSSQFEVPMLFLIVSSLVLVMGLENAVFLSLAWLFVVSRIAHSFIHMTYNHVLHRMLVFNVGVLSTIAMWIVLLIKVQ